MPLKAAVAKQIREHDFPDLQFVKESYTHNLDKLLKLSSLKPHLDERSATDPVFAVNWTLTKDWNESARYSLQITEVLARDLHSAITDQTNGVLPWLKKLW